MNALRDQLPTRPRARTLSTGRSIPAGFEELLLYVDAYDYEADVWFWDLIRRRLRIEVRYDSLYGGEAYRAMSELPYDDRITPTDPPA